MSIIKYASYFFFQKNPALLSNLSILFSISKIAVSTPSIYKRFKEYNKGKSLAKQIKPFNFFLVGQKNHKNVKSIAPYSNNSQLAVYKTFIDYKSGKRLKGLEYWKNLADTILEYANHPESKFVNGSENGKLERRHVNEAELIFIGKEVKNLEQLPLLLDKPLEYKPEKEKNHKNDAPPRFEPQGRKSLTAVKNLRFLMSRGLAEALVLWMLGNHHTINGVVFFGSRHNRKRKNRDNRINILKNSLKQRIS